MQKTPKKSMVFGVLIRIVLCVAVLVSGVYAMNHFSARKKAPHKGQVKERVLQVDVQSAVARTVETRLQGFGVVRPAKTVNISAEVGGRITHVHPDLDKGLRVPEGDILFKIDPSDYQAARKRLSASLLARENEIAQIEKEFQADRLRLKTMARNKALATDEYERVRVLLEENSIGNRSEQDQAEQAMNKAIDAYDQMQRSLALYPLRIKAARAELASVRADLDKAEADLARCIVRAPFTGRVTDVSMEAGEYASPGKEMVALADDAVLEIPVSLDAREATRWLYFENNGDSTGWFGNPRPVTCDIQWLEAEDHVFKGTLDRVMEFDQTSRTVTVAILFDPAGCDTCPPLVEGMFCRVSIPGKSLSGLYSIKRWFVSTDDTVYKAEDGRLKTARVNRVYTQGDDLYLTGEIRDGDLLITTRLVDPIENSALKIMNRN